MPDILKFPGGEGDDLRDPSTHEVMMRHYRTGQSHARSGRPASVEGVPPEFHEAYNQGFQSHTPSRLPAGELPSYSDYRRDRPEARPPVPQGEAQDRYRQFLRSMGYPEETIQKMLPEWPPRTNRQGPIKLHDSTAYAANPEYEGRYCSYNRRVR